ncbi:hypothetical protein NB723_001789 [Xanthomonas sacchari]|nr:hypothetical protein [Xanthomonas sacchari]
MSISMGWQRIATRRRNAGLPARATRLLLSPKVGYERTSATLQRRSAPGHGVRHPHPVVRRAGRHGAADHGQGASRTGQHRQRQHGKGPPLQRDAGCEHQRADRAVVHHHRRWRCSQPEDDRHRAAQPGALQGRARCIVGDAGDPGRTPGHGHDRAHAGAVGATQQPGAGAGREGPERPGTGIAAGRCRGGDGEAAGGDPRQCRSAAALEPGGLCDLLGSDGTRPYRPDLRRPRRPAGQRPARLDHHP